MNSITNANHTALHHASTSMGLASHTTGRNQDGNILFEELSTPAPSNGKIGQSSSGQKGPSDVTPLFHNKQYAHGSH